MRVQKSEFCKNNHFLNWVLRWSYKQGRTRHFLCTQFKFTRAAILKQSPRQQFCSCPQPAAPLSESMSSTMAPHGVVLFVGTLHCATRRSSSSPAAPYQPGEAEQFHALGKGQEKCSGLHIAFQCHGKDLHPLFDLHVM